MREKPHRYRRCSIWFPVCLVAASLPGCSWDDSLYKKYVGDDGRLITCMGHCENANHVSEDICKKLNMPWVKDVSGDKGRCLIQTEAACAQYRTLSGDQPTTHEKAVVWIPYHYQVLQLGADLYIRFIPDAAQTVTVDADARRKLSGKYYCGTFEQIRTLEDTRECTQSQIDEMKGSFAGALCPQSASVCGAMEGFDFNGEPVGMCSQCPSGQILCDNECRSIFSDTRYCGGCSKNCDDGYFCDGAAGFKREIKCEIKNNCNSENSILCRENGVLTCTNIASDESCGGCVPPAVYEPAENTDDVTGNIKVGEKCESPKTCVNKECGIQTNCAEGTVKCYCDEESCQDTYQTGSEQHVLCLDPLNPGTCGLTSCSKMGEVCPGNKICVKNDVDGRSRYECICPEGTYWSASKGICTSPDANETCGATAANPDGIACDPETSVCVKGVCRCFVNTVTCFDEKEKRYVCVDPNSDETCGAHFDETSGVCKSTACVGGEKCIRGKCQCQEGFAYCDKDDERHCVATRDEAGSTFAHAYCGAKGKCADEYEDDPDYRGEHCSKEMVCRDGKCQCKEGIIECNGVCVVSPEKNDEFCGTSQNCEDLINCNDFFKNSKCGAGKCICPDPYQNVVIDGIETCRNTYTDHTCCGRACTDCTKNTEGNILCVNGECSDRCIAGQYEIEGHCIDEKEFNVLHLEISENGIRCKRKDATGDSENITYQENGVNYRDYCDDDGQLWNGCEGIKNTERHCGGCTPQALDGSESLKTDCTKGVKSVCGNDGSERLCVCPDNKKYCVFGGVETCIDLKRYHMTDCSTCEEFYVDADGDLKSQFVNGCESDVRIDVRHCGTQEKYTDCYDTVQNVEHDDIYCEDGVCKFSKCIEKSGYADCDGNPSTGCEGKIGSTNHCMVCNDQCKTGQSCLLNDGCKYDNGQGCDDCTVQIGECKTGLKLWREVSWFFGIKKNNYQCAEEQPGKYWKEIK